MPTVVSPIEKNLTSKTDQARYMSMALLEGRKGLGLTSPNPPVGAVIVDQNGLILGKGFHHKAGEAHAEINAIDDAIKNHGAESLRGADLYVTLEPCLMCAGAAYWTQIGRIVFGAYDEKRGYSLLQSSVMHPSTEVSSNVLGEESKSLLQEFFTQKRKN